LLDGQQPLQTSSAADQHRLLSALLNEDHAYSYDNAITAADASVLHRQQTKQQPILHFYLAVRDP
jgi:hypothetical protein